MKKKFIFIIVGIIIVVLLVVAVAIPQKDREIKEDLLNINYDIEGNETELSYDTSNPVAAMYIKDYGSIVIELYPSIAPNTVNNFVSLIRDGFYDNNSMHRLIPNFVLQGGDPTGTGSGGPGYSIKGEFSANGFENDLSHEEWVVSMARSGEYDSGGSQFFICLGDATYLDSNYAAFGKVIDGFETLKNIEKYESIEDTESGKLRNNLVIKKALIDLNGKEDLNVEKIN